MVQSFWRAQVPGRSQRDVVPAGSARSANQRTCLWTFRTIKTRLAACLTILVLVFAFGPGCSGTARHEQNSIRIKGSDTMLLLVRRWAEEFMRRHPGVSVYVDGGGTGTGAAALAAGDADICAASRTLTPSEVRTLASRHGRLGIASRVARDAIAVFLHPDNPVESISMEGLRAIFSGKSRNWADHGGDDAPIRVINRPPNSGTYRYFRRTVLGGDEYMEGARTVPTNRAVARAVQIDRLAIGYGGAAYAEGVKICEVNDVPLTSATISTGTYPISRYLYLYTLDTPRGALRRFIDWAVSADGQRTASLLGYVPILRTQD